MADEKLPPVTNADYQATVRAALENRSVTLPSGATFDGTQSYSSEYFRGLFDRIEKPDVRSYAIQSQFSNGGPQAMEALERLAKGGEIRREDTGLFGKDNVDAMVQCLRSGMTLSAGEGGGACLPPRGADLSAQNGRG